MKRQFAVAMLTAIVSMTAWAQGPNNSGVYYQSADGKKGEALKTALYNKIKLASNPVSYDGLWTAYKTTDKRADGYLRDWYSNSTNYEIGGSKEGASYQKEGDSYNREHLVPQSWFGSGTPKSDLIQVVPVDGYVNNRRSNYVLAEVGTATYTTNNSYCKLGNCVTPNNTIASNDKVFEPNDEVKGDIARIYFYMATSYQDKILNWGGGLFTGNTYQPFEQWYLDMLMRWSAEDPIDDVEIARNNSVYSLQHNRNPFVDYPGLEDYIWGDKVNETFSYDNYNGTSTFVYAPAFTPADGTTFTESLSVTLSCQTGGATIYYTTDGSTPSSTNGTAYTAAINLTETTTIKAIAYDDDGNSSNVATATYTKGSGEIPAAEGTFIFNTDEGLAALGITKPDTGKGIDISSMTLASGNVSLTSTDGGTATRVWNSSGNTDLRIYSGGSLTFTSEKPIVKIEFTSPNTSLNYIGVSSGTWIGESTSVTFTATGTARINTITVTLKGEMVQKQDVTMSFSESSAEATMGETFTPPSLTTDPSGLAVTYESSNTGVATVDAQTGAVTLVGAGTTTITASFAGNDDYNPGSASYTLVVSGSVQEEDQWLMYESFSSWTSGNEGGNIELTPESEYIDYTNWSTITKVYPGANGCGDNGSSSNTNGCGKFGSSKAGGVMTTGTILLTGNGQLTFKLKKYSNDAGVLNVTITGASTEDATSFSNLPTEWKSYTVNLTEATGEVTLSFESTKRLYIDDIMLVDTNEPVEPEIITIPVSSVGYATMYYSDKNLVVPENMEAYTYKMANDKLTVSTTYGEGEVIPAGTGVVLKAAKGSYEFEVSEEGGLEDGDNLLHGSDMQTTINEPGYKYYMLSLNGDSDPESVGFYWGKNSNNGTQITNGAHKAYLAIPTSDSSTNGAKSFFLFNDLETTDGIKDYNRETITNNSYYNLNGQRVSRLQKGIYVVNGRKVLVK